MSQLVDECPVESQDELVDGPAPGCVVVGRFLGMEREGDSLVAFTWADRLHACRARSIPALSKADVGCDVVLAFERNNLERPVILGVVAGASRSPAADALQIEYPDGLILRCGSASITLSPEGRVTIRGSQILSRASGTHRIKGGSVQIN